MKDSLSHEHSPFPEPILILSGPPLRTHTRYSSWPGEYLGREGKRLIWPQVYPSIGFFRWTPQRPCRPSTWTTSVVYYEAEKRIFHSLPSLHAFRLFTQANGMSEHRLGHISPPISMPMNAFGVHFNRHELVFASIMCLLQILANEQHL